MNYTVINVTMIAIVILILAMTYYLVSTAKTRREEVNLKRDIAVSKASSTPDILTKYAKIVDSLNAGTSKEALCKDVIIDFLVKDINDATTRQKEDNKNEQ